MSARNRPVLAVVAGLAVAGCFSAGDGGGCGTGLVGNGDFEYVCTGKADAYCGGSTGIALAMPDAVALGSRFRVQFKNTSGNGGGTVKAVSEKAIKTDDHGFTTLRTGRVGFVAFDGEEAVDAIRVRVVEPRSLGIGLVGGSAPIPRLGSYTVSIAEAAGFAVQPLDDLGASLAGTLVSSWTIDDPTIASVTDGHDGTCVVSAGRSGRTRLRVAAGTLEDSIGIVVGDPLPDGDGGLDEDAGGDAGDPDAGPKDDGGGA
jgi:hypothetical protein